MGVPSGSVEDEGTADLEGTEVVQDEVQEKLAEGLDDPVVDAADDDVVEPAWSSPNSKMGSSKSMTASVVQRDHPPSSRMGMSFPPMAICS